METGLLKLRLARVGRGWTLFDVAQRSRVTISRLSLIERSMVQPSLDERRRIAEAFGAGEELFEPVA